MHMLGAVRVLVGRCIWRIQNGIWPAIHDWLKEDRRKTQRRIVLGCGLLAMSLLMLLVFHAGRSPVQSLPGAPEAKPTGAIGPGLTALILVVSLIAIWLAKYYYMDEERLHWAVAIAIVFVALCAIIGTLVYNVVKAYQV
jgi:hypothetical protein